MHLDEIHLKQIKPPRYLLRFVDTESMEFEEMLDSISDRGLLQPILVRPIGDTVYEVVEGNYRYTCCRMLKLEKVPCIVRELTDEEVLEIQIEANSIRPETDPVEYAARLQQLLDLNPDLTIKRLSITIHRSETWITEILRLRALHGDLKSILLRGELKLQAATELARLPAPLQHEYLEMAQTLTVREFKRVVSQIVKQFREASAHGRLQERINRGYEPVPFLQKMQAIKAEYETCEQAPVVLTKLNARSPIEGWKAALAWILNLDPDSVETQRLKNERRIRQHQADIERRKADRRRLRKRRQTLDL